MGNGMNRVLPGLYVGNYRDSKDAAQLDRHKITHIIAIHDAARNIYTDKEYLCIAASDTPYQNLTQYFPVCNDFIHCARMQGGNVLIHCLAGMSRSVTIVVAYLISVTSLRWNEALKVVRGARAVSNPNSGFQKQLQDFENTKLADERRRLVVKFHGSQQLEHDEENCRRLLIAYDHLLLSKVICDGKCVSVRVCPTKTCRSQSVRFCRQRSGESSPRGSTKSLDASGTGSEASPESPRSWERHYGVWRNRARGSSNGARVNSSPASPILYRASKSGRSDSMLSISSISSLPGQDSSAEKDSPSCLSIVDRNPLLSSQSCPNSPRRMPRKPGGAVPSTLGSSLGPGVSPTDVTRLLEKDRRAVTLSAAHSHTLSTPTSSFIVSKNEEGGAAPSVTVTASRGTPPQSPCHRFMAHNASVRPAADAAPGPSRSVGRNTIRMASGITRWVMKRSAYKFNLDKSS